MGVMNKPKIIYFGTPEFAIPPLEALIRSGYDVMIVVTAPVKSAVKEFASRYNLKVLQPQSLKDDQLFETFKKLEPELCIVASYGKIIPQMCLDIPKFGFINIHPSLLPKYRGPSPVPTALLNGDTLTGVTIMKLDAEMDHGPIVAQQEVSIEADDNFITLIHKLFDIGTKLLINTLPDYLAGKIQPQEQDHSQATYSQLIKTEDAEIKLDDTVITAINKIRALNPEPGTYILLEPSKKMRLKILGAEEIEQYDSKRPILKLKDGCLLLNKVQPEGKKIMTGEEWFRGNKLI